MRALVGRRVRAALTLGSLPARKVGANCYGIAMKRILPHSLMFVAAHILFIAASIAVVALN